VYKIIKKLTARRLTPNLSKATSEEQFGVLVGRKISNAVGIAQEVLHSIKILSFTLLL
jgi:hypothetical protein